MLKNYNLNNIRTLFKEGFSESELRGIYLEQPVFRPVFDELSKTDGIAEIVHQLIEYARRRLEFEPLLAWAKEHNPKRYECHQPYEESSSLPPSQAKTQGEIKGNIWQALEYHHKDLKFTEQMGDAHNAAISCLNLDRLYRKQGDPDQARICYQKAKVLFEMVGDIQKAQIATHWLQQLQLGINLRGEGE